MKVVVIGAGIVGASVAYHLMQRGIKVEIVDSDRPGAGTSTATFAYLNALRHAKPYAAFRLAAMTYWHALAAELDARTLVHADGSLFCPDNPGDTAQLEAHASDAGEIGLEVEWLTRADAMRDLEPDVLLPDTGQPILRVPQEGRLEIVPMIARLLGAAEAGGAVFRRAKAWGVEPAGPGVRVDTDAGPIFADGVVVAAGAQTPTLLQAMNIALPIELQPGVVVVTRPTALRLSHVVYAHKVHFQPDSGGRILAGCTDYRTALPRLEEAAAQAQETLALLRPLLRGFDDAEPECLRVGIRSIPADGLPMVGPVPGLPGAYVAVMHSGITLAGLVGSLLAEEIVDGTTPQALLPYRPERFLAACRLKTEFAPWAPGDVDWAAIGQPRTGAL